MRSPLHDFSYDEEDEYCDCCGNSWVAIHRLKKQQAQRKASYDMSMTERETYDSMGTEETAPSYVNARDDLNPVLAKVAGMWMDSTWVKWPALVAVACLILGIGSTVASGPLLMLPFIAATMGLLAPQVLGMYYVASHKMIVFKEFKGYGSLFQKKIIEAFERLEAIAELVAQPDVPAEIVAAYERVVPFVWSNAWKIKDMLAKLNGVNPRQIEAATKSQIRQMYVNLLADIRELDELFAACNSYHLVNGMAELDHLDGDAEIRSVRDAINHQMQLTAGVVDEDDDLGGAIAL